MSNDRLTPAQNRHIFALKRERGLSLDDLRDMTPAGSISMLTRAQANVLIDALKTGKSPDYNKRSSFPRQREGQGRRPKGVASMITDAQRQKVRALRLELGWSAEALKTWLSSRRFHGEDRYLIHAVSADDVSFIIELLKRVRDKTEEACDRRAQHA